MFRIRICAAFFLLLLFRVSLSQVVLFDDGGQIRFGKKDSINHVAGTAQISFSAALTVQDLNLNGTRFLSRIDSVRADAQASANRIASASAFATQQLNTLAVMRSAMMRLLPSAASVFSCPTFVFPRTPFYCTVTSLNSEQLPVPAPASYFSIALLKSSGIVLQTTDSPDNGYTVRFRFYFESAINTEIGATISSTSEQLSGSPCKVTVAYQGLSTSSMFFSSDEQCRMFLRTNKQQQVC